MSSFKNIYTDSELQAMKTRQRAITKERDRIAIEIAKVQNMPSIWTLDMIDWDDPKITSLKEPFHKLENQITALNDEIREAEAIRDNTYDLYCAEEKVYSFLNSMSPAEALSFLKQLGMTTHMLIGEVAANPNFLEEREV